MARSNINSKVAEKASSNIIMRIEKNSGITLNAIIKSWFKDSNSKLRILTELIE